MSGNDAAHHAGVSQYRGRSGCNAFSLGIELEGCDFEPFTEAQYQALMPLLHSMAAHYPIEGDDRPHGIGADLRPGRGRQVFEGCFGNDGVDDHTRVGGNVIGIR